MPTRICRYCHHILTLEIKDYKRDSGYDSPSRWIERYNTESCPNCGYFKRLGMSWQPDKQFTRQYWNSLPTAYLRNHTIHPQKIGDRFTETMKIKPLRRW